MMLKEDSLRMSKARGMRSKKNRAIRRVMFGLMLYAFGNAAETQTKPSNSFQQVVEKAQRASAENRLDDAAKFYSRALALRPRWEEGWWSLGTIQYDQDKYGDAAKSFSRVVAIRPQNGTAHAMLGLCEFEMGKDSEALKQLQAAEKLGILKDEQLRKVAVFHLGVLQLRDRKFNAALETLLQLAKDHVRTEELVSALGQAALLIRPEETPAEGHSGRAVVEKVGKAEAGLAEQNFAEAKKIFDELVAEYPAYPNLHVAYGRFLLATHEIDGGVAQFQEEIKNNPGNVPARLQIAAVRYRVDSEEGLKYAKEALDLAPKDPFAHYIAGMLCLDMGKYQNAVRELETAKANGYGSSAELYFALGNAYARVGRTSDAAKARATFSNLRAESNGDSEGLKSNKTLVEPTNP